MHSTGFDWSPTDVLLIICSLFNHKCMASSDPQSIVNIPFMFVMKIPFKLNAQVHMLRIVITRVCKRKRNLIDMSN